MKRNKWLIALAAGLIHICAGTCYGWSVLTKFIVESCGFSTTATTFIFSLCIFSLGCGAATMGRLVDKYGARKIGIYAGIVFMLGYFISALAIYLNSLLLLYIGYGILTGGATGALYVTPISLLIRSFPGHPGAAGSVCIASFGLAAAIFSPIMVYLVTNFGLISNFLILGILYGIIIVISSLYFPPKSSSVDDKTKSNDDNLVLNPSDVYKTWQFKTLFISFTNNIGSGIAILALIALMLIDNFGFSALDAAFFVSLCSVANSTGRFIWASLSDIVGCPNMYLFYAIVGAICYTIIATTTNLYLFEIAVTVVISLYGGFFSAMPAYLKTLFSGKYLSTIHGRILFSWGIAGLIFPVMLSGCKDLIGSYSPMLYLFIILMLINSVILWKIKKDSDNREDYIHDIR